MSNDNDYGESDSWVRGVECNGGQRVSRTGKPRMAFEQRPEGSASTLWLTGKAHPRQDCKSQVPAGEVLVFSVWISELSKQRGRG